MRDNNPIATARRRARHMARFGPGPLICILCGYPDPVALIPVTIRWLEDHGVPRSLLEGHHVYYRNHDPDTIVPVCRNCHAELTEGTRQAGVNMHPEPNPVLRVALMLEASAVFHEKQADAERQMAKTLRETVAPGDSQ